MVAERGARPRIDGFEIDGVIGRGGFATVYRARQVSVDRDVAVKVLSVAADLDADAERRFRREVRAVAALSDHPHVVGVIDAGTTDRGRPFIAMQLIEGGSYGDRVRDEGALPAAEVARVGLHAADALEATHDAGIVHRDIKPDNILIGRRGRAMITDFGIASIETATRSRSGAITGTLLYMAPEVLRGARATPAADVCSLATTLHTLITGRPAYLDPTAENHPVAVMSRIASDDVPLLPATVPAPLRDLIHRGMAASPDDRPDIAEVAAALRPLADLPEAGPTPAPPSAPARPARVAPPSAAPVPAPAPPRVPALPDPHAPPPVTPAVPPARPSSSPSPAGLVPPAPASPPSPPRPPRPAARLRSTVAPGPSSRRPSSPEGHVPPTGPDRRDRRRRAALAILAALVIIALTAALTHLATRGDDVADGPPGTERPAAASTTTSSTTTTTTEGSTTTVAPTTPATPAPTVAPTPPATVASTTTTTSPPTTAPPTPMGPDDSTTGTVPLGGAALLTTDVAPGGDLVTVTPVGGWDLVLRVIGPGIDQTYDAGLDGEPESVFLQEGSYELDVSGWQDDDFGDFVATVG